MNNLQNYRKIIYLFNFGKLSTRYLIQHGYEFRDKNDGKVGI